MKLSDYPAAIKSTVKTVLPHLRQLETHSGEITPKELLKMGARAPAVFITLAQIKPQGKTPDGYTIFPLVPVIYVVTTDTRNLDRFETAINLVQSLCLAFDCNTFGIDCVNEPDLITSRNLFNGEIDKEKMCLWAISWKQEFYAGESLFDDDGVVPKSLYIGIAPDIGPENIDKYEQVPLEEEQ